MGFICTLERKRDHWEIKAHQGSPQSLEMFKTQGLISSQLIDLPLHKYWCWAAPKSSQTLGWGLCMGVIPSKGSSTGTAFSKSCSFTAPRNSSRLKWPASRVKLQKCYSFSASTIPSLEPWKNCVFKCGHGVSLTPSSAFLTDNTKHTQHNDTFCSQLWSVSTAAGLEGGEEVPAPSSCPQLLLGCTAHLSPLCWAG